MLTLEAKQGEGLYRTGSLADAICPPPKIYSKLQMSIVNVGALKCDELVAMMKQSKKDFWLGWSAFSKFPFPIDQRLARENIGLNSCEAWSLLNVTLRMTCRLQARQELLRRATMKNITRNCYIDRYRNEDDTGNVETNAATKCEVEDLWEDREWPADVRNFVVDDERTVRELIQKMAPTAKPRTKRLAVQAYLDSMELWADQLDELGEEVKSRIAMLDARMVRKRGRRGGQGLWETHQRKEKGLSKSQKKALRKRKAKMTKAVAQFTKKV